MNTFLTNEKTINITIIIIILYCGANAIINPMGWELITLFLLPIAYKISMQINNTNVKKATIGLFSIVYGLLSTFLLIASLFSGFLYQNDFIISLKTLLETSPLILGFVILSLKSYMEFMNIRNTKNK